MKLLQSSIMILSVFTFLSTSQAQAKSLSTILPPEQAKLVLKALKNEVNKGYLKCQSPEVPSETDLAVILVEYMKSDETTITASGTSTQPLLTVAGLSQNEASKIVNRLEFTLTPDQKTVLKVRVENKRWIIRSTNRGDLLNPVFEELDVLVNEFNLDCVVR